MDQPDTNQPRGLGEATKDAVEQSLKAARSLREIASQLSLDLSGETDAETTSCLRLLEGWEIDRPASEGDEAGSEDLAEQLCPFVEEIESFQTAVADWNSELALLMDRQEEVLQTFNVAMFGRTGAGKSTLIEAMVRGDGQSVSPLGRSDYTTEVATSRWEGCRLYDTPGINGWGASDSREALEARAKKAVEVADFVLICFDNYAQLEMEFQKVAAWVQSFNKPAIAVLNIKNQLWRFPERVSTIAERERKSTAVRQNAANIGAELGKIGLTGVPVIAMSSQRALFARASEPFRGPGAEERSAKCAKFGKDRLLHLSNFTALEDLLAATIGPHANELRLGVLHDQLRGEATRFVASLEETERRLREQAEQLEHSYILPMLRFIGYPAKGDAAKHHWFQHRPAHVNVLQEVESARGGRFPTAVEGTFARHLRRQVRSELGKLRTKSLRVADRTVDEAFDDGREIGEEEFAARCLDVRRVDEASQRILENAGRFLERETELLADDFHTDLQASSGENVIDASFEGKTAKRRRIEGRIIKVTGILTGAGAATTLTIIGVANIWNPVGWAALGGALLSTVFGIWGKKRMEDAKAKKLAARSQASADARKAIHQWYDEQTKSIEGAATSGLREAAKPLLVLPLAQELVLLRLADLCSSLVEQVEEMERRLPPRAEPLKCLRDGMRIAESWREVDVQKSNELWLGEDWVRDPVGLTDEERMHRQVRTRANDPGLFERLSRGFGLFFRRQQEILPEIDGAGWLETAMEACADDNDAQLAMRELEQLRNRQSPEIHFVGDYSAGKTSLIKRLLIDEGCDVPDNLTVRGDPTTSEVAKFEYRDLLLVDTPGLQSGNEDHTAKTLRAFSKASWIVYVFHPNLVLGDDTAMQLVLNGSCELGMVPKKERTLFLINRADELGCDPPYAPAHFASLVDNKKLELIRSLRARGIVISADQIHCVSSDPYGRMGDQSGQGSGFYDENRSWDGIKPVVEFFRAERQRLQVNGVDRSLVEGGVYALASVRNQHERERRNGRSERGQLSEIRRQVEKLVEDGESLLAAEEAQLVKEIETFVDGLIDECMAAKGPKELKQAVERLKGWPGDKRLEVEIERWNQSAAKRFDDWTAQAIDLLQRRLESREFQTAGQSFQGADHDYHGPWEGFKFGKPVKATGDLVRGFGVHRVIYNLGKSIGYKFRPWEAVKISKGVAKAGIVLAWIGVVLDGVDFLWSEWRDKKEEEERKRLREGLRGEIPKVVRGIGYGYENDEGLLTQFAGRIDQIREVGENASQDIKSAESRIALADKRIADCQRMIEEAEALLGNPWNDEQQARNN